MPGSGRAENSKTTGSPLAEGASQHFHHSDLIFLMATSMCSVSVCGEDFIALSYLYVCMYMYVYIYAYIHMLYIHNIYVVCITTYICIL